MADFSGLFVSLLFWKGPKAFLQRLGSAAWAPPFFLFPIGFFLTELIAQEVS